MEHIWKLYESSFEALKKGEKKREYRLNDEKRRLVRVGDTIRFQKLPNLDEEIVVDVTAIETFATWFDCYSKYYEEDFKDRYDSVEEVVKDTYAGGYYTEEESNKLGCIAFTIKKHRIAHLSSAACYLRKGSKVLMLKYTKKWGHVYTPPGGKFEEGESPLDCVMREFYEETGLTLINPKLQGISYWKNKQEGVIYIFTAESYKGKLLKESEEGTLEWIELSALKDIPQFSQNEIFTPYIFQNEIFEGKFLIDENAKVIEYGIRTI